MPPKKKHERIGEWLNSSTTQKRIKASYDSPEATANLFKEYHNLFRQEHGTKDSKYEPSSKTDLIHKESNKPLDKAFNFSGSDIALRANKPMSAGYTLGEYVGPGYTNHPETILERAMKDHEEQQKPNAPAGYITKLNQGQKGLFRWGIEDHIPGVAEGTDMVKMNSVSGTTQEDTGGGNVAFEGVEGGVHGHKLLRNIEDVNQTIPFKKGNLVPYNPRRRVVMSALKDIEPGDEMTTDYSTKVDITKEREQQQQQPKKLAPYRRSEAKEPDPDWDNLIDAHRERYKTKLGPGWGVLAGATPKQLHAESLAQPFVTEAATDFFQSRPVLGETRDYLFGNPYAHHGDKPHWPWNREAHHILRERREGDPVLPKPRPTNNTWDFYPPDKPSSSPSETVKAAKKTARRQWEILGGRPGQLKKRLKRVRQHGEMISSGPGWVVKIVDKDKDTEPAMSVFTGPASRKRHRKK